MVDRHEQAVAKVSGGQRGAQRDDERFLTHPTPSQRPEMVLPGLRSDENRPTPRDTRPLPCGDAQVQSPRRPILEVVP
jgi:hypothetical protein